MQPDTEQLGKGNGMLDTKARQDALRNVHEWTYQDQDKALVRTLTFPDFRQALAFVNRVGDVAEQAGHHPDIDIRYNRVRFALSTHDAGGVTAKDFDVARQIDALVSAKD